MAHTHKLASYESGFLEFTAYTLRRERPMLIKDSFAPLRLCVKKRCRLIVFILLSVLQICEAREIIPLRSNWKFARGNFENASMPGFDDSKWQVVAIPHDWAIQGPFIPDGDGNTGKLPWKGEGWYRNILDIPENYQDKQVYLVCDGIMSSPEIYINGKLAGRWDYGYNSFYIDITSCLVYGKQNILAIHADTRNHDSRWYPGAGIFRKIEMIVVSRIHVGIWGTYITTPVVKQNYCEVKAVTTVINSSAGAGSDIKISGIIISPEGREIISTDTIVTLPHGRTSELELLIPLPNPQRWEINNGVLYTLKTVISSKDGILDVLATPFGVRTMRFTADHGFYLNDRRVQLKGVNLHHDHGPLGAAFNERAMQRQLEIMRDMGCNAVRTSHNTAAPELLDLCDKMGILVFNEVFDKYDKKADISDTTDFEKFSERNIRNFVVRDRNHPSVFIWSVGNEMGDVQNDINHGFARLKTMVDNVRKFDATRPVTMVCDDRSSAVKRHFDLYDAHCWNYGRRYDLARQLEPKKSVIVSESASTLSTRGFYELPLPEKKTDFTRSLQVSSYDLNAPWWAELPDDDFMWQQEEEYVSGEFAWTGFDYLGEPTPYNNDWAKQNGMTDREASYSSYFGMVDLCGIPKDRYYLYKSFWKPDETTVHLLPHWNWTGMKGKKVPVFVYTNGDCAELFLNGRSLGTKCKKPESRISTERFRLIWNDVVYEPGELKAIAFKEGMKIGEKIVMTAGEPFRIRMTPDHQTIRADGMDLSFILIEAFDMDGNPCPLAENPVELKLNGPGLIAGVGNGNPRSYEPFQACHIKLFSGKAMLIVQSGSETGEIEVIARSNGLIPDKILIKAE